MVRGQLGFTAIALATFPSATTTVAPGESPRSDQAFHLDFTDRSAVIALFEEGSSSLTTDGSLVCERPDHLRYNATFDDGKTEPDPPRGLQIRLDNKDVECNEAAMLSTGHLRGYYYYSYGDFTVNIQAGHAVDSNGKSKRAPANALTCLGLYELRPTHNEICICWNDFNYTDVSFGYWLGHDVDGDVMHRFDVSVPDNQFAFHTYTVVWRPTYVALEIDKEEVVRKKGISKVNGTLPWLPLSVRLILRPRLGSISDYEGDAFTNIPYLSYVPWHPDNEQEVQKAEK